MNIVIKLKDAVIITLALILLFAGTKWFDGSKNHGYDKHQTLNAHMKSHTANTTTPELDTKVIAGGPRDVSDDASAADTLTALNATAVDTSLVYQTYTNMSVLSDFVETAGSANIKIVAFISAMSHYEGDAEPPAFGTNNWHRADSVTVTNTPAGRVFHVTDSIVIPGRWIYFTRTGTASNGADIDITSKLVFWDEIKS